MARLKPWAVCCFVLAGLTGAVALVCLCIFPVADRKCPAGAFTHAAVSADSLRCSEVGRSMLQQGGSAVDGAIAALLCTSVVNPQSMGIGGGSILTIRNTKGASSCSPQTHPQSSFQCSCTVSHLYITGSQWIGVPGELRGYEAVHKQYGKLPWAKLFEPTIKLAREGISLPAFLGKLLQIGLVKDHVEKSSLCEVLCNKNKTVLSTGDILKFPKLAETMQTIAAEGAEAFYTGKIGHDLIQDIEAAGGTLKKEDLQSFQVRVEDAWTVPVGDAKIYVPPPPAGGPLLAFILRLMKGFPLSPNSLVGDEKILTYHRYIEAAKFTNGQRSSISDPVFNEKKSADHLNNASFINRIRGMILSNSSFENSYYFNAKPSRDHVGTTHVSILDEDGLAVSVTSTINQLFGGGIYSPRTGVILNNELSDFCGRATTVRAGEQPPSSMIPVIVESKSGGLLVIGGSGGSMITSAVAMSMMNRLWLGMNLKDAIAAPIVFVDSSNGVNFEPGFDKSVEDGLLGFGHKSGNWRFFFNVVNAVEMENGCIVAVSDRRKGGMSAGY
uniref:Glutathione hydrolase n=1 Tax=Gasterosteus aculeatus aculeatus TaxID=481459 RepID=A0AAQ4RM50_GASAC